MPKRHLVTSALPYANGPLHIGHIAGAYLPADIYVRYLRRKYGHENVLHVCGSDEHGAAISMKAIKEGTTPKAIVDQYHTINKQAFAEFGIDFDIYHRTSSDLHRETSQEFFLKLHEKGVFKKVSNEQMYDPEAQQFLADRFIMGTCPNCGSDRAYGDQCENCGKALSPTDLIDPKSTLSGTEPTLRSTWHFYLPMGEHAEWVEEFIRDGRLEGEPHHDPAKWRKPVVGQCLSWIEGGLGDRAMTRDLDWGVPVPLEDADGKVLYVWLDAPIGYVSATKQWAVDQDNPEAWKKWWQDAETDMVHFIGKDNIVFHCIIFPILLKMHGGYNLPVNVPANEFLNLEGDKISTSRNHAVWLHEYLEDFPDRKDELRYVLTSIAPETKDSEFTWKDYQARVNNELVAILGNFVNRVVVLTNKYYDGVVPFGDVDDNILAERDKCMGEVEGQISNFKFRDALSAAMNLARYGNKYLADSEPWKLQKSDPVAVKHIMFNALNITAFLAEALDPFLPDTSTRLREMLKIDKVFKGYLDGHEIGEAKLLFAKVEDTDVDRQMAKLAKEDAVADKTESTSEMETPAARPFKDDISFDEFMKLDIRVGTITSAEKVKKADKLLQLSVDLSTEVRTIVSGIAEHFTPEEVIGKQVSVLCNLEPRKIRGVESQGMILMAEDATGKLQFISPLSAFETGAEIR
ncbi:MAG: methionine--tRNA ligase [Flavobacteriales bacterium]|nr:methionine--tRNA ligase [Flavobacteriales bacterium]